MELGWKSFKLTDFWVKRTEKKRKAYFFSSALPFGEIVHYMDLFDA